MKFNFENLQSGEVRAGEACLIAREERSTRKGDPYLVVTLGNRSGRCAARIWSDKVEDWAGVAVGDGVNVKCTVTEGWNGGAPELSVDVVEILGSDHPIRKEINPECPVPRVELVRRFRALVDTIVDPEAHVLLDLVLDSERNGRTIWEDMVAAPAAMTHHHAYLGGLLEHSIEVATISLQIASVEPYVHFVDPDVLIVSSLLHDLGKVEEYKYGPGEPIGISEFGRLRSHLCRGSELVALAVHNSLAYQAGVLSPELVHAVQHVIESHHGEYGSTVQPAFLEAAIVHLADLSSSRLRKMVDVLETAPMVNNWAVPSGWKKSPIWNLAGVRGGAEVVRTDEVAADESGARWRAMERQGEEVATEEVVLELDSTMAAYVCYLMCCDLQTWTGSRKTRLSREDAVSLAMFLVDQLPTGMKEKVPPLPPHLLAS